MAKRRPEFLRNLAKDVRIWSGPRGHPRGFVRGPGLCRCDGKRRVSDVAVARSGRTELSVFASRSRIARNWRWGCEPRPFHGGHYFAERASPWVFPCWRRWRRAAALAVAAREAAVPCRAAYLYFPNGAWMDEWVPKKSGAEFELPFCLTPLEPIRQHVTVLSGLDKPFSRTGDGHYAKTANFLTGLHVRKTTGQDLNSGGVSVDQVAAARMGHSDAPALARIGHRPRDQRPRPRRQLHANVRVVHLVAQTQRSAAADHRSARSLRAHVRACAMPTANRCRSQRMRPIRVCWTPRLPTCAT